MCKEDWQERGAGHRQRLRDAFLERGLTAFSDAEIVEMLLALGTPRKDCKDPSRELFKKFGSLSGVLEAAREELQQVKGVGPKNSFALHFIHAVARRYLQQRLEGKTFLGSSSKVADFLIHAMRDLKKEVLMVLFLDASHAIIASEILAEGTLTSNTIHPRELIKAALAHNAAALILAHNHPSGSRQPSAADKDLTRKLFLALSLVHIRLLDHFIVAGSESPYSFADAGIMDEAQQHCQNILDTL